MIDSELLAPKLGLSVDALQAEMRKGLVVSTAGIDDDEGRTRLTFRYRAQTWWVVVESSGICTDAPPSSGEARMLSLFDLVRRAS